MEYNALRVSPWRPQRRAQLSVNAERRLPCPTVNAGCLLPAPDIPARYGGLRFLCTAGFAYIFPEQGSFDRCSPCSYIPDIIHGWWWHNSGPYLAGIGHSRNSHRTHTHTRAGSLSLSLAVYREAMGFFHYRRFVCKSMAFCTLHPL